MNDVSPAFGRQARQRNGDAASLPARRDALDADLRALIGRAVEPEMPSFVPRNAVPKRLTAELVLDELGTLGPSDLVRDMNAKLAAEDARLRRILPPAPRGKAWRGEFEWTDSFDRYDFRAELKVRIVYRLVDA